MTIQTAVIAAISLSTLLGQAPAAAPARKPKLVVGIIIDQFKYDYLQKFQGEYKGGFARLARHGANFTNAHYEHFPTVTAIGHSVFMSGATPAVSGIIGNSWWDANSGKTVTSVSDDKTDLVGATGAGSSPRRLLVSTIPDELKISGKGGKSFGISIKDRSAIMPAGHMANGAFWFDTQNGAFVSSTYYMEALPEWVVRYNEQRNPDRYLAAGWKSLRNPSKIFPKYPSSPGAKYAELDYTPFSNDMVEALAERAVEAERLGQGTLIDFLSVSFSGNDYVGHWKGPDSDEVHDMAVRTDLLLEKFFLFLDKKVGLANTLIVLSADHGVAPTVEANKERKMPGERLAPADHNKALEKALSDRWGEGKWITNRAEYGITLNRDLISVKGLNVDQVREFAAETLRGFPGMFRVFTHGQLMRGQVPGDRFHSRILNGFFPSRSADVTFVQNPYFLFEKAGTTHGLPFAYDTHVPVIFMGPGVKAGRYHKQVAVSDIAPTLATMLEIEIPSGAFGRVLDEMLVPQAGGAAR